jgi:hypothetical protein
VLCVALLLLSLPAATELTNWLTKNMLQCSGRGSWQLQLATCFMVAVGIFLLLKKKKKPLTGNLIGPQ